MLYFRIHRPIPSSACAVLVIYGIYFVLSLLETAVGGSGGGIFGVIITMAVFGGLCGRWNLAYHFARWTSALSVLLWFVLLPSMFAKENPWIPAQGLFSLLMAVIVFWLLGRPAARAYFTRTAGAAGA